MQKISVDSANRDIVGHFNRVSPDNKADEVKKTANQKMSKS